MLPTSVPMRKSVPNGDCIASVGKVLGLGQLSDNTSISCDTGPFGTVN